MNLSLFTQRAPRLTEQRERARGNRDRRPRPGVALAVMLGAQLMIIIDVTAVNIALPHIQAGLRFSATSLSWVMNGYALAFGGLMLLGGRAGDILGRRRMFLAGVAIFTLASLAGGLATSAAMLLAARAVQGAGGAIASPAVLALLVSSYTEGKQRVRALALYSAVVTGGSSLGLVLGGMITQWASWRWVLFINVPIGIAVAVLTPLFVTETPRQPGRFDLPGAVMSTAGVAVLAYAFIRAASSGWSDHLAIASFTIAVVLLVAFVLNETRAPQPIAPLRLFADRGRSGSFVARLLYAAGLSGLFYFLTLFLQDVRGLGALATGFAFLPITAVLFVVSRFMPRLISRFGAYRILLAGMIPMIIGLGWLSRVSPATGYWSGVFAPIVLFGAGMGAVPVPLTSASLAGVRREDSGAASSMVNVTLQLGSSVGLAVLVAAFSEATRDWAAHPVAGLPTAAQHARVLTHGISAAFEVGALLDALTLLVIAALLAYRGRHRRRAARVQGRHTAEASPARP